MVKSRSLRYWEILGETVGRLNFPGLTFVIVKRPLCIISLTFAFSGGRFSSVYIQRFISLQAGNVERFEILMLYKFKNPHL